MSKNVMQDVIPKEKRSIRNIPIPGSKKPRARKTIEEDPEETTSKPPKIMPPRKNSRKNKKFITIGIVLFLIIAIGSILTAFGSTTITITPKTAEATVDNEITALSEGSAPVLFQMVELEDVLTKQVPATGTAYTEDKAQGTITVYNNFDEKDQRLITNTRFESPDGKIYRIRESIVVPGKDGDTPGKVEATVYADEPGPEYNISEAKFTIPGFKGDPRYSAFYAEAKTPISGGFKGEKKQVAEGILDDTRKELDTGLRANLLAAIQAQVPEDLIVLENLVKVTYEDMPEQDAGGDSVTIGRRGRISAPLIQNMALASNLAKSNNITNDVPSIIPSFENVSVSYVDDDGSDGEITFSIKGQVKFVALLDEEQIRTKLAGKPKSELFAVLKGIPGVASAEASISPFWVSKFPKNAEKITIVIK